MSHRSLLVLLACLLAACAEESPPVPAPAAPDASVEEVASGDDEAPWWEDLPRAGWAPYPRVELPEDQGWFEVHAMGPGTWAILEPGQWQEVISWLIEGEEKALLFDTGLGIGNVEQLARALTERELVVLNSHTHFDHVGGNHDFREILGTEFPFAVANAEGRTHEQCLRDLFTEGAVWMPLPEGFDKETCRTREWTVTGYVADGDVIDLGGRSLEVLFTPGHSPDSLSLFEAGRRTVYVGDTFYPAPLYAHLHGGDFEAYRASAARLATLADRVDLVATGHNEPVQGGAILVETRDAFEAVAAGREPDETTDSAAIHAFDTFSIIKAL